MLMSFVNIVVAHALEAKPLVKMLGMEKDSASHAYPIYKNKKGECLIISGIGKEASISATSYLANIQQESTNILPAWLNLGIAGHQSLALGELIHANKITEYSSGLSLYPPMLVTGFNTDRVITVDEPELKYPENAAYEMEAFGFYSTATRFISSELVQVLKIVSDNSDNHVHELDFAAIPGWFSKQQDGIVGMMQQLDELAKEYNAVNQLPEEYYKLLDRCNFSVTQTIQLKRLFQRYRALGRSSELTPVITKHNVRAKKILLDLNSKLNSIQSELK